MTSIMKVLAFCATLALSAIVSSVCAQDDLDALLKDLDGDAVSATPVAEESKPEEPKVEAEKAAEEATTEIPEAEDVKVEDVKVEEKAEEKIEEAKTEEAKSNEEKVEEAKVEAEKPVEEVSQAEEMPKVEEKTESAKNVDEVLMLLDDLAAESAEKAAAAPVVAENAENTEKIEKVEEAPVEAPKAEEEKAATPKTAEPPQIAQPSKPVRSAHPDAELIENLRNTEKLRREALDAQAMREIKDARLCMENKEYGETVRHYGLAMKLLNDRTASKELRRECDQGVAEGLYRAAMQEDDLGRRGRAQKLMEKALDMRHPKARRILERWNVEASRVEEKTDDVEVKHRQNEPDYKLSREQIRKHLRRSRQYLAVRDIAHAKEECESVLVMDPYNQDAIRLLSAIQRRRQVTLEQEHNAARADMISDVEEKWRPVYALNAARPQERTSETVKKQTGEDPERTVEQDIERRMKEMRLPTISFKPPATIIDAVDFFRGASKDYDRPDIPIEKRGFNFVLRTPQGALKQQAAQEEDSDDFASNGNEDAAATSNGLPPIPTITASDITFYEALKLVCDSVDYKFIVRGPIVMVMHKDMSTAELLSRKYDVLDAFLERMTSASADVREMKSAGFGGSTNSKKVEEEGENQEKDWKGFFEQMGVKWPEGSSIMYIKTLGKLYVRNTRENLAEFEKVLQEMGSQPKLIEIETRFVEVSQEDLNSLGFEWILNSDYSLDVGNKLGKALGIGQSMFEGSETVSQTLTGYTTKTTTSGGTTTQTLTPNYNTTVTKTPTSGARLVNTVGNLTGDYRTIGINAFGGTDSQYGNGNRYLSTDSNHISGEAKSTNDQFMRVNAFLGEADLSMILHMLSQRSDTDLLSAPKVVTKSGENAVMKVVTEFIYPQDYDVQLQSSSSSSSGSYSGGSQSGILAIVEPQNFTMREVGVILDVTPTYSEANGGTIDLELKPSVVELAEWHNYGMQIPFTGNTSSGNLIDIGGIFTGMATALEAIGATLSEDDRDILAKSVVASAIDSAQNVSTAGSQNMTWYEAPMKQPFFHTRSIDSKVSITPGATVVMGGLITEERRAMDDKIPYLGDLPYIGRLFRSHAEQTKKRNLLIFVTGRLITPAGRELALNEETSDDEGEVKAAPKAE